MGSKFIGAGLATIACAGAGVGIGNVFASLLESFSLHIKSIIIHLLYCSLDLKFEIILLYSFKKKKKFCR